MAPERVPFSTLLRDPKAVTALVEGDDVLVERRDGADFVMRSAARDARERRAMATLGWLLAGSDLTGLAEQAVESGGPYPWVRYLPAEDRHRFVAEVADSLRASAELGSTAGFDLTVEQWRHTAEVFADPELCEALTTPIEAPAGQPVPRP